jgi:hypothetical protein
MGRRRAVAWQVRQQNHFYDSSFISARHDCGLIGESSKNSSIGSAVDEVDEEDRSFTPVE